MQQSFPVDGIMPELHKALEDHGQAVLTASPGSGKSTRVPLALLGLLPAKAGESPITQMLLTETGKASRSQQPPAGPEEALSPKPLPGTILVLEPRRLAARAAARHMARLLGEDVGQKVGYRVRLDNRVSAATRVEMLTEGMFTRRLLADPELQGVSCVIFDEFHERGLQSDLGLALCLECREAFRPDLRLLIMSATLKSEEISAFLGGCPIIRATGRQWPVEVRHARQGLTVGPASPAAETAAKAAGAVREALAEQEGSILLFLPGRAEISRCAELLARDIPGHVDIFPLYGDLPPAAQDAAIAPAPPGRRKVVLSTDLAQTSLTIEGVRLVIDAGLARAPRFEPGTGLSRLITRRLARDAADQRAGRAGRLEPGFCLRLWPEGEALAPRTRPEILDADLSPLLLDVLAWGGSPDELSWLTPPPEAALQQAEASLIALGAAEFRPSAASTPANFSTPADASAKDAASAPVTSSALSSPKRLRITARGRSLSRLPLHPRLAAMVLLAAEQDPHLSSLAACLAALVSERDPLRSKAGGETDVDVRLRLPLLRRPENAGLREAAAQIYHLSQRFCGCKSPFRLPGPELEDLCGPLLSLAWPERIARQRDNGTFLLASGQGAELPAHDPLSREPWLVLADIGGGLNRRARLAAPLSPDDIFRLHGPDIRAEEEIFWDNREDALICRRVRRLGALILEEKALPPAALREPERQERAAQSLLQGILSLGLDCLPWTGELRQLQARVLLLRGLESKEKTAENPWPDLSDAALRSALEASLKNGGANWLAPWLHGITRRSRFADIDLGAALRALLPWPLPRRLEEEAPARLDLPSGSSARIDYLPVLRGEPPVLAVKLQEMFGQGESPRLAGGRAKLVLHLLSPAGRPLQVTTDLGHFWANAYAQVRSEMRGRYPRHPWPENPLTASPTGKSKRALDAQK